jgi:ClpP class serine protease
MPNWNSVLREIALNQTTHNQSAFDLVRRKYLRLLQRHTGRNVIAYYSGFLSKARIEGTEINDEDKNGFMACIHNLDREKGLDLILHTPGGDGAATESLVHYLRSMFKLDIRAIVPQIAMSAGTMIACSCNQIIMGRQSSLGPIDPQFGVIGAVGLIAEVKRAYAEIIENPNAALFWSPILSKLTPSFLQRCEEAVKNSNDFITKTLAENMFAQTSTRERNATIRKVSKLLANEESKAHNTHFQYEDCETAGLNVKRLEEDQKLQDLVLTVHHCYMHTLSNTPAFKIIENHLGRATVKMLQQVLMPTPISLNAGGPS